MHEAAYRFVERMVRSLPKRKSVLEIGSRNVNGTVRSLFGHDCTYHGIDWSEGPGVDEVADGATWRSDRRFDTVVTTECLEHAPRPDLICHTAYEHLNPGGVFIVTAASVGRWPHSGIDGGPLRPGEWYANVDPADMRRWLEVFAITLVDDRENPGDVYALAVR